MGFCGYLQANTAVDVLIGPFIDDTDGKSAETGLTLSQADIKLSKNGQTLAQKNDDTAAAHDANGYYNCELDATDTNTEGTLTLIVHKSGALPVRHDFMVLAQAAYISLVTAKDSGYMDVNVKAVSEDTTAADNAELMFDGTGYAGGTTKLDVNVASIANNAITAAAIQNGAIDANTFAAGALDAVWSTAARTLTAIDEDSTTLDLDATIEAILAASATIAALPTAAENADAVWDEASTGHTDAGKAGAQMWTDVDAILADTGTDGVKVASLADNSITAAAIANGAIDQATFAADVYVVANVKKINGTTLTGDGGATPWGPA